MDSFENKYANIKDMRKAKLDCYRVERYNEVVPDAHPINKENGKYLINTLAKVLSENGVDLILAYGTLLGAIREHDFIGHDLDMDTMIWAKDMQKVLDLVSELEKYGIELDCYALPWIITFKYKDITCDLDVIWGAPAPWKKHFVLIQSYFVPRKLFAKTTKIEFQGQIHVVPADYEKVLVYHYGKNWRIPSSKHARIPSYFFFGYYVKRFFRRGFRFMGRIVNKMLGKNGK